VRKIDIMDEGQRMRLEEEVEVLQNVGEHPNIMSLVEHLFDDDESLFMVMKYAEKTVDDECVMMLK
jgi:serine/threonine protein kinase